MGTRHLICVVKNGEYKVSQYGQWDGYPDGQGMDVLKFLTEEMNRELFEKKITELTYITDEEYNQRWLDYSIDIKANKGMVSWDDAENFDKKHPELSRNTGAKNLGLIQNSDKSIKLNNSLDFAKDSLFCEWAYVIDLDKNTFESYKGFNKEPLLKEERFYSEEEFKKYYPVKHVITFDLDNLPTLEEYLKSFYTEEENEEEIY